MALTVDAPDIFTHVAEVLSWIEPDPAITKDDSMARPVNYQPDHLYAYPDDEEHVAYESGPAVRQNFRVIVDLTLDDRGESAGGARDLDITSDLRERAALYAKRVADNQRTALHEFLRVARIEWNVLNGVGFRGFRMRLEGYRLWS